MVYIWQVSTIVFQDSNAITHTTLSLVNYPLVNQIHCFPQPNASHPSSPPLLATQTFLKKPHPLTPLEKPKALQSPFSH